VGFEDVPAFVNRANGQFRLPGRAELSDEDHIKIALEGFRNDTSHGYGSTGHAENQRTLAPIHRKSIGEQSSGLFPIPEAHNTSS
jgi:hypothetical protein